MQHSFCLPDLCGEGDAVAVTRWDAARIAKLPAASWSMLRAVVDTAGVLSAQAQALSEAITSLQKAVDKEHVVYLAAHRCGRGMRVLGLAKSGRKRLYLHGCPGQGADALREVTPVCLLDFYVHESAQRQGWGRALLVTLLAAERQTPEALAYDRPSPKLQAFMAKHFALQVWRPQTNAFVVFEPHFWIAHGLASWQRAGAQPLHRGQRSSVTSSGDAAAGGGVVATDWQAPAAGASKPRADGPRVLLPPPPAAPGLWFAGAGATEEQQRPQGRLRVAGIGRLV